MRAISAPAASTPDAARPSLGAVVRHLSLAILVANVIPSVLFYACLELGNMWLALTAALMWCYAAVAWRLSTRRRVSGLLVLTLVGLTGKTAFAFASGSTFLYFLQPALADVALALLFAGSLLTARPLVARVAGDFYPMDEELHARPRIQRLFWRLTLMWAFIVGAKAAVSLWLLGTVSATTYATVKSVVAPTSAVLGAAITVVISAHAARHEGLLPSRRTAPALA
ncbi:MAG TPA: VC0807 family protein [Sporichthya sp.]|nr:VC0807 family protein [Sporichthya sp.]